MLDIDFFRVVPTPTGRLSERHRPARHEHSGSSTKRRGCRSSCTLRGETWRVGANDYSGASALLTGRLMSADGHPLVGRSINCMNSSGGHPVLELQQVRTDARGGFRCEIPSGGPFELYSYAVGYAGFAPLARQLTVQAGEQIDFGELVVNVGEDSTITVTAKNAQSRTKPPAADPANGQSDLSLAPTSSYVATAAGPERRPDNGERTVTGSGGKFSSRSASRALERRPATCA